MEATDERDRGLEVALRLEPVPTSEETTRFVSWTGRDPSRRLMLATLADAIATFRRTAALRTREDARAFAEVAHWFGSDETGEPFAFLAICRTLGLDAAYLRQGLKSIRRRARVLRCGPVLH